MLAANMSAARVIAEAFPDRAMLRCHPPPNAQKMLELAANVKVLFPDAPHLDVSSSGALQQSLHALRNALGTTAPEAEVVTLLCTKPMQNARYFCTGDFPDPDYWRHYALAVTHYTHFTSPIRRYPDVVVHRLLMAAMDRKKALDHPENCTFTDTGTPSKEREGAILSRHGLPPADAVSALAARANERKMCAKAVQDGALQLYLTVLLLNEPRVAVGVISVLGGSRFVDVYVPAFGIDVRVHVGGLLCGGEAALSATWNAEERCLQLDRASTASAQACEPNFHDIENAAVALNPENLPRMKLPVTLRPLGRVTLLVGAKKSKTSGSPAGIHAKLWIE